MVVDLLVKQIKIDENEGTINSIVQIDKYLYLAGASSVTSRNAMVWKYDIESDNVVGSLATTIPTEIIGITKDANNLLYFLVKNFEDNDQGTLGVTDENLSLLSSIYLPKGYPESIDCDNQYLFVALASKNDTHLYYRYNIGKTPTERTTVNFPKDKSAKIIRSIYADKITKIQMH
jgi:hypothetical protein